MLEDEEIARIVRGYGWYAISVPDHQPEFTYTCGLTYTFQHPEAIILGLPAQSAYSVLAALVENIRRGRTFAAPERYEGVMVDFPIGVRRVHPSQHELYLGWAMGHCRHMGILGGLVAVQVFWPDKTGRLPFEVGCDQDVLNLQPRLDVRATRSELRAHRRLIGDLD